MVETSSLSENQIDAMMKRIHSVPIIETLQMEILRLDKGECEGHVPRAMKWDGIYETFHGGLLGTIADTVTCWAILTVIGSEAKVATTDFNIRFLRPCNTDVRCVARVIKAGRTMSLSEAELYDSENNLVAVAQVNYIKLTSSRSSSSNSSGSKELSGAIVIFIPSNGSKPRSMRSSILHLGA